MMSVVQENLNVLSRLSQPRSSSRASAPPNWTHSFQNADLIALLVFIKHSFVILFSLN